MSQSESGTLDAKCRMTEVDMGKGMTQPEGFSDTRAEVYRFSINMTTLEATETCLVSGLSADFPVVPPQFVGYKTRYCYCSVAGDRLTPYKQATCALISEQLRVQASSICGVCAASAAGFSSPRSRLHRRSCCLDPHLMGYKDAKLLLLCCQ
jgi:carotenoid cleavage dioxygenase-like enzyme